MRKIGVIILLLTTFTLWGCQEKPKTVRRAMYYWRTTLSLSDEERQFMLEHHVERLYMRYFDVVNQDPEGAMPNATLSFEDTLPRGVEVIPVVYVMNDCMRQEDSLLAGRILKRVLQMNETNGVEGVRELQIDCDWTLKTRRRFFKFMEQMRELCHQKDIKLSATIRLHQLSQPAPPADRGVLMVYNTGDVTQLSEQKPILDLKDVSPYLINLPKYRLDLSAAYPLFKWRVLFRGGHYVGIMHADDDLPVLKGDSIVIRQPSLQDIMTVRKSIGECRNDVHREVVLYDLSKTNIQRFNSKDYEKIYEGQ